MGTNDFLRRASLFALCSVGVLGGAYGAASQAKTPARFKQDRFCISFWVDPPADRKLPQRYREIADANFNVAMGGFGATTSSQIRRQLDVCNQLGLKALVSVAGHDLKHLAPDHPALWGYMWVDEPSKGQFGGLAADVARIRELRPGRLTYINLLPDYANAGQLGVPTYKEYLKQFVDEVKPDVLSMDYYPLFKPDGSDGRDGYCGNLAAMREESLRADIPFWNFFNIMPFGPHTDPTESQVQWQIYASLAYGAKGIMYFCYYTPVSPEFPKGGAIIARDDRPTRHYDQAKRINAELKALGPTLMKLTSTRVVRIKPETTVSTALQGGPIRDISGSPGDPAPNYLVGEFRHSDGRRAVLLQNYEFAYTAWPTVEFDVPVSEVMEVDKKTGKPRRLIDESPEMKGMQLSLDAGEGRLFLLPSK